MKCFSLALCVSLAGCGGGTKANPTPGVATVTFVAQATTDANLTITAGDMSLQHIAIGGASPPPHNVDTPMLDLGLVTSTTMTATATTMLTDYPPDEYSVVLLDYHGVMVTGSWRGTPFTMHVEPVDTPFVHPHAATPQELGDNENIMFTVSIDVNNWFDAGGNLLLDGAAAEDQTITIDDMHNPGIAAEIAQNISASFSVE